MRLACPAVALVGAGGDRDDDDDGGAIAAAGGEGMKEHGVAVASGACPPGRSDELSSSVVGAGPAAAPTGRFFDAPRRLAGTAAAAVTDVVGGPLRLPLRRRVVESRREEPDRNGVGVVNNIICCVGMATRCRWGVGPEPPPRSRIR